MSERCIICKKELADYNGEICKTCLQFFKWKYKTRWKKELNQIIDMHKKESRSNLNSQRRKK